MIASLLNGVVHSADLDGWKIRWESDGYYRHWCSQVRPDDFNDRFIAVCLFNPGSLSGDGRNLARDTTLRVLREVFAGTSFGCVVLNLFDRATPKPDELFSVWHERDKPNSSLIYSCIPDEAIAGIILAYGDYEHHSDPALATAIKTRISALDAWRGKRPLIASPKNKSGTPKHVMRWQIEKMKSVLFERIAAFNA